MVPPEAVELVLVKLNSPVTVPRVPLEPTLMAPPEGTDTAMPWFALLSSRVMEAVVGFPEVTLTLPTSDWLVSLRLMGPSVTVRLGSLALFTVVAVMP